MTIIPRKTVRFKYTGKNSNHATCNCRNQCAVFFIYTGQFYCRWNNLQIITGSVIIWQIIYDFLLVCSTVFHHFFANIDHVHLTLHQGSLHCQEVSYRKSRMIGLLGSWTLRCGIPSCISDFCTDAAEQLGMQQTGLTINHALLLSTVASFICTKSTSDKSQRFRKYQVLINGTINTSSQLICNRLETYRHVPFLVGRPAAWKQDWTTSFVQPVTHCGIC